MSTAVALGLYLAINIGLTWYRERAAKARHREDQADKIAMRERINNIEEALSRSPFITFKPPSP